MTGGFCEKHGPFDAPHVTCPYCAKAATAQNQRFMRPADEANDEDQPTEAFTPLDDETVVRLAAVQTLDLLFFLIVKSPVKLRGRAFRVEPGQVIGRKDADVLINDKRISRQHSRINVETDDGGESVFAVYDFGTPNGTFVNGKRILGRFTVRENDEIQMGDHVFLLKVVRALKIEDAPPRKSG